MASLYRYTVVTSDNKRFDIDRSVLLSCQYFEKLIAEVGDSRELHISRSSTSFGKIKQILENSDVIPTFQRLPKLEKEILRKDMSFFFGSDDDITVMTELWLR